MTIRIAALIQAHHKPESFRRLVGALSGDLWCCYAHIDARSKIEPFREGAEGVVFVSERHRADWASYRIVKASISLLRAAFADRSATHFYLLSGQCYPLKSNAEIAEKIENSEFGGNYMTIAAMPVAFKTLDRIDEWHLRYTAPYSWWTLAARASRRFLPKRDLGTLLNGMTPHCGDAWWLIDREAAGRILGYLDRNPDFIERFRYSHCSDEMFFQTLFVSLGLRADGDCPTSLKFAGSHPEIIGPALYAELSSGWHLMARKFDGFYP